MQTRNNLNGFECPSLVAVLATSACCASTSIFLSASFLLFPFLYMPHTLRSTLLKPPTLTSMGTWYRAMTEDQLALATALLRQASSVRCGRPRRYHRLFKMQSSVATARPHTYHYFSSSFSCLQGGSWRRVIFLHRSRIGRCLLCHIVLILRHAAWINSALPNAAASFRTS